MSNGIQRFYNYEAGTNDSTGMTKVYQTSLLIQFILAVFVFIALEIIGVWYVNEKMVLNHDRLVAANWVFQASVVSLVILILQVPYSAAIIAHEKMDYFAIVSIFDVFLKLGVVLILPQIPSDKLIIYGFLELSISIVNFFLYFIYAKHFFIELTFALRFHRNLFKSIFAFSGWNVSAMFAWMTQNQGVNMVMNLFFGPIINASRGVSGQVQAAIQGFCENLVIAFRPQLVQSYAQGDFDRTRKMMYSMSKILFILFFVFSTPVIFEIDFILHLWLGNNIPDYTESFTILVLLSMYPRNFAMAFAQVVHATGKMGLYQIVSSITILSALPLSYVALKMGADANSVYWINLIVCSIMFIACLSVLKKQFPIDVKDYIIRVLLPCSIMALLAVSVPFAINSLIEMSILRFLVNLILDTLSSIGISYLLILDSNEKKLIKKIMFRR
jgi:O-antigen/teichoic acid export membrane protein